MIIAEDKLAEDNKHELRIDLTKITVDEDFLRDELKKMNEEFKKRLEEISASYNDKLLDDILVEEQKLVADVKYDDIIVKLFGEIQLSDQSNIPDLEL
jgi:hypothetical protein